jgi:hypothetical protein
MKTKQPLLIIVALLMLCLSSFASTSATEISTEKVESLKSENFAQYEVSLNILDEVGITDPREVILIDWYSLKPKPLSETTEDGELSYFFTHKLFCDDVLPGDANLIMSNHVTKRAVIDRLLDDAEISEQKHASLRAALDQVSENLAMKARMEAVIVEVHKALGTKPPDRETVKLHFIRSNPNYHGKGFAYGVSGAERLF